jgi:hypothetical protein
MGSSSVRRSGAMRSAATATKATLSILMERWPEAVAVTELSALG